MLLTYVAPEIDTGDFIICYCVYNIYNLESCCLNSDNAILGGLKLNYSNIINAQING